MSDERLAQLEKRVEELHVQLKQLRGFTLSQPTTLVTPVHIVTPEGQLIASIEQTQNDRSIHLFNAEGNVAAALGVDGSQAGYLAIRSAAGELVGYLDVETYGARLQITGNQRNGGVVLFGGDSGDDYGGGLHIMHTSGGVSISLWSDADGGELVITDGQTPEHTIMTLPFPAPHV